MPEITLRPRSSIAVRAFARLCAIVILVILPASALRATEYFYVFTYGGTQYTNNVYFDGSLLPDDIKGVVVTFNYGATVYADPAWRNFAKDRGLALLLMINQDDFGIPASVPDMVTVLSNTLSFAATASGYTELSNSNLPLIMLGVSRGGTSGAINLGWAEGANRTVACLAYHGNSFNYLGSTNATAVNAIPVFYPTDQLDSGPYRQTDIETAVRTTNTTTLNGSIAPTAFGYRPTSGLYWTTTMQYGYSHATVGDDTYPLQWLGRVWDARYNPAKPGVLQGITNALSLEGSYRLLNGASSTAYYSNCVALAFSQRDTNVWIPPGGGSEWVAANSAPHAGVPLMIDSTFNTVFTAPENVLNRSFSGSGTIAFTGAGLIGLDNSGSGGNTNYFVMTGGTLVLQHGVTLRNGAYQGGVWTNNLAAMAIDAISTLDLWNGNPVWMDALNGNGTITISNSSGVNWAGARSLILGDNNGSGTFNGLIAGNALVDGGSISLTKMGYGTQTLGGICRYSGKTSIQGGTLALAGILGATASVEIYSNATLQLVGGSITNGSVQVDPGGLLTGNGFVNVPLVNNGTVLVTNGTLNLSGNVTNYGTIRLTGGARLIATNGVFVNNGVLDIITGAPTLPDHFINHGSLLNAQQVLLQQTLMTGNGFQVSLQGYSGHNYQLMSTPSLGPGENWTAVGPPQAGTGAMLTLTDATAGSGPGTFYRVLVAP